MSPTCAITFSASLGRRGDQLLAEFDGLFASSPRAMSDMLHFPGKVSQWVALASQATTSPELFVGVVPASSTVRDLGRPLAVDLPSARRLLPVRRSRLPGDYENAIVILCQYRPPCDPPRAISGALLVSTFHLHGVRSVPASLASLGRRSDRLLGEFDGLFAPSPRAMSDMRDIAGKVSQSVALALPATTRIQS
ncbi:hypothetical protein AURDEDRAFT_161001 [Auricularia subglabra TFB-10046 SS5]|nr:hypothetical protein AURDEDRAFT_161001 [Auricularia subglabra TFB-10046 SS5]